jgi:hypothetical protein
MRCYVTAARNVLLVRLLVWSALSLYAHAAVCSIGSHTYDNLGQCTRRTVVNRSSGQPRLTSPSDG